MRQRISFQEAVALARSGDREAQYALSCEFHQRGKFDECLHWLRLAAAQKLVPAQITLATFLMDGRRCQRDRKQAIDLLEPLAASEIQASLLLSELYGFAALGGTDRETALRFLLMAAQNGHVGAMRQLGLLCICHDYWHLAHPLLSAAARGGDAAAEYASTRCHADGVGDPPTSQIDWSLLGHSLPRLANDIRLPTGELLHEAPFIRRLTGVIHPLLLDMVINLAAPLMKPSMIFDARTGEARVDSRRNSTNVTISPRQHDHVLEALESCISRVSGLPALNGEFLQIMRYRVGEEFKPHVDYLQEGANGAHLSLADGGQRAQTVLMYLNDDYGGGGTYFPALRIEIKGRRGDMLHFHNLTTDGRGHKDSLHAGMPVRTGEKWLLSQWIRADTYPNRLAW